ncbi:Phage protein U [Sphingomonas paucimobilis]|nr:Phage protein U [Sphingomonas paucimobilis]
MLLSLGLFAFGIDTLAFDEIQRKSSWRHATATRIGARDASQFHRPR